MRSVSLILVLSIFVGLTLPFQALAQTATPDAAAVAEPVAQAVKEPLAFGLADGTPVKLRVTRNLSSADAKTGETVDFEVLEDVKFGETVIVPRGGTAIGTVTRAKRKGRMAKGGKLDITIDFVTALSGEKVALRAVKENKGKNYTGTMTGLIAATGILFFPAAPFFLFMKGKDIKIPKGTEITAYVSGYASLDRSKFPMPAVAVETPAAADPESSAISVKSTPEGAEISVDGKFVGSTPSSLSLKAGEYTVTITKPGYVTWERKMVLSAGGNITVDATLEKTP